MTTAICIGGPRAGRTITKPDGCEAFRSEKYSRPVGFFVPSNKPAPEDITVELVTYCLRRTPDGAAWVAQ